MPQVPAHRLFLAVKPDADAAGRIAQRVELGGGQDKPIGYHKPASNEECRAYLIW